MCISIIGRRRSAREGGRRASGGLEGDVIVLTEERDLGEEVCGKEKGEVETVGGAGGVQMGEDWRWFLSD